MGKLNKRFNLIILALGLWISAALAGSDNTGLSFLRLPVDARSAAMGEIGVALSGDAGATFRNPAALAFNTGKSLVLMHNAYLADIAQEFAAFQFLNGKHSAAIALNVMDIPGIEIRGTRPTTQPEGKTDAINLAFAAGYAYKYGPQWAFGVTVKYLFEKYFMESASGWALDFGVQRTDFLLRGMTWGLALQNAGKMDVLKAEASPLPLMVRTGVQYELPRWLGTHPLIAAEVEQLLKNDDSILRLGLEVPLRNVFVLRTGLIYTSPKIRYSFGFGVNYHHYQVNYAFSPYPFGLGNSHRFSLSWLF